MLQSSNIAEKSLVDARRKLAYYQRSQLSDLYYGRNRPSSSCSCVYLVSADFVSDWKAFVRCAHVAACCYYCCMNVALPVCHFRWSLQLLIIEGILWKSVTNCCFFHHMLIGSESWVKASCLSGVIWWRSHCIGSRRDDAIIDDLSLL